MNRRLALWALATPLVFLGCRSPHLARPTGSASSSDALRSPVLAPTVARTPTVARAPSPSGRAFAEVNTPLASMTQRAAAARKPALLYFCASWCGFCQKLNRETLSQARVASRVQAFPASRYDPDTDAGRAAASRFDVHGFPTIVVMDEHGREVERLVGFRSAEDLLQHLGRY